MIQYVIRKSYSNLIYDKAWRNLSNSDKINQIFYRCYTNIMQVSMTNQTIKVTSQIPTRKLRNDLRLLKID